MPRFGVEQHVLGLEGAEGGGGFVVAADGGAEAREEGVEAGVGGHGGGWGVGIGGEMRRLFVVGLGGKWEWDWD